MNRRRFLQALFAVPCLGAPLLVPTVVSQPEVYALSTAGGTQATTLGTAHVYVDTEWRFRGGWAIQFVRTPGADDYTALLGEGG